MAKKRSAAKPWPERLAEIQTKLALTNEEVADRLGVPKRTWLSWKYGERTPSVGSARLIELLERGKI